MSYDGDTGYIDANNPGKNDRAFADPFVPRYTECPHCAERIPEEAIVCPECGCDIIKFYEARARAERTENERIARELEDARIEARGKEIVKNPALFEQEMHRVWRGILEGDAPELVKTFDECWDCPNCIKPPAFCSMACAKLFKDEKCPQQEKLRKLVAVTHDCSCKCERCREYIDLGIAVKKNMPFKPFDAFEFMYA